MATPQVLHRYRGEYTETYGKTFVTAVATTGVVIDLPPGWYDEISVYGISTNSGTASTLLGELFVNSGQTAKIGLHGGVDTGATVAPSAITLVNGANRLYFVSRETATVGSQTAPIYIPHGLKMTYTAEAASAVNLTLAARKVG